MVNNIFSAVVCHTCARLGFGGSTRYVGLAALRDLLSWDIFASVFVDKWFVLLVHVRGDNEMRASAYVGRVGGLAVVLGIGVAAGGMGVAWAAPADTSGSAANADSSASTASTAASPAARSRGGRTAHPVSAAVVAPSLAGVPPRIGTSTSLKGSDATGRASHSELSLPKLVAPSVQTGAVDRATIAVSSLAEPTGAQPDPRSWAVAAAVLPESVDAPQMVAAPAQAAAADAVEPVLSPLLGTNPGAPVQSPASWVMLAAVRRELGGRRATGAMPVAAVSTGQVLGQTAPSAQQPTVGAPQAVVTAAAEAAAPSFDQIIQYTLFHKSATANPVQAPGQSSAGVVTGNLNASTDSGATLIYTLAQAPVSGSVALGPDGSYTYTPSSGLALAGGGDAFSVTIDNGSAYRLTGFGGAIQGIFSSLAQLIGLRQPDTVGIAVPVAIVSTNTAPVASSPTVGTPNATTGVVIGQINAADPEGGSLTFSGSTTTSKGVVIVAANGGFTYTPTVAARRNAYLPGAPAADLADTFTVTATDALGLSVAVPVTAAISPELTFVSGDVIEDAASGRVAVRSYFSESTQEPGTGTPGYLNWLTLSSSAGAAFAFSSEVQNWANLFLVGTQTTPNPFDQAVDYPTDTVLRNPANDAIAIRTIFDQDMTWLIGTTSEGGLFVPPSSLQGWEILRLGNFAPVAGTPTVGTPNITTGLVIGQINATDPDGDTLTYSGSANAERGAVTVNAGTGAFNYTPTSSARGIAASVDTFTAMVTDSNGAATSFDVSVPVAAWVATNSMINYVFNYTSGAQYWSADAISALQFAADKIASYVVVTQPVTLTFDVTGEWSSDPLTLASAGSNLAGFGFGYFYTVVQNKILQGIDSNGSAADGVIDVNFGVPWSYGDTVGYSEYDFASVLMHEVMHAYGFISAVAGPGDNTRRSWPLFTSGIFGADGTKMINTDSYLFDTALDVNLTGGDGGLYFAGTNAVAAYGGLVPLYTPYDWTTGSSVAHLDDYTFRGDDTQLMNATADTGPRVRVLSPVEQGILMDIGYTLSAPSWSSMMFIGLGFFIRRRRVE